MFESFMLSGWSCPRTEQLCDLSLSQSSYTYIMPLKKGPSLQQVEMDHQARLKAWSEKTDFLSSQPRFQLLLNPNCWAFTLHFLVWGMMWAFYLFISLHPSSTENTAVLFLWIRNIWQHCRCILSSISVTAGKS